MSRSKTPPSGNPLRFSEQRGAGSIRSVRSSTEAHSKSSGFSPAATMSELMAADTSSFTPLQKGSVVEGTVKKLEAREILLDIGYKSDALVIEYDKTNLENLLSILKVGDRVKATVISPESEEGFPVVSLRRTLDDLIFSRYDKVFEKNEEVSVHITEPTRGGYFAESAFGIRGFLPNSQVYTSEDLVGKTVQVKIIEFDRSKKRVIFSQKATHYTSEFGQIEKYIKAGDVITGTVTTVTPYGLYVEITPQKAKDVLPIEGFVHISEISHNRVTNLSDLHKKGEALTLKILDIDRDNRRVNASVKSLQKDSFEEVMKKYKKEQKVKGIVREVKTRGVTVEIEPNVFGFIPENKIPSGITYIALDSVEVEITDFDPRRRLILVTPVLKAVPIGYR